jgi:hypothetical protein
MPGAESPASARLNLVITRRPSPIGKRLHAAALAVAVGLVLVGCGPSSGSPGGGLGGSFPAGFTIPPLASTNPLPGSNAACLQMNAPLSGLAKIEADLRSGNITDAVAETQVLGVQQFLVQVEQQVGGQAPLGVAIQGVVDALGDLGTALNQNAGIEVVGPELLKVDSAVAALATACLTAD